MRRIGWFVLPVIVLLLPANAPGSDQAPLPFHEPALLGAIRGYQRFLSTGRGATCPMTPSCSAYAYEAFSTMGPFRAALKTSDRLHRCSHDLDNYVRVEDELGQRRFLDPVDAPAASAAPPGLVPESVVPAKTAVAAQLTGSEQQLFGFAESLRAESRHDEGALEYRRFLSYYPGSALASAATVGLFHTEYQRGRYSDAIRVRDQAVQARRLSAADSDALAFWSGAALVKVGNYQRARSVFTTVFDSPDPTIATRARLLDAMTYALEGDWSESAIRFERAPGAAAAAGPDDLAALAREGKALPRKKPALAGILAIVPGLGYLYDGYRQSAFSAALVNGLFLAGTYRAFKSDNNSLGTILTVFSIGWYGGNVYGSVISAERKNAKVLSDHLRRFNLGFQY
jgi:tetratricopeptide (TPR) repeat protein